MSTRGEVRVEVRVDPATWASEVERLRKGSPARVAAERELTRLQESGVARDQLLSCTDLEKDGTRLAGELKTYVPIGEAPASQRPFGFVFSPAVADGRPYLALIAFGERHPMRGVRSVYERAHKRLHGRYPDQERSAASAPPVRSPRARQLPDRGGASRSSGPER